MKVSHIVLLTLLAAVVWGVSANFSGAQAKYEKDVADYEESVVEYDMMPRQPMTDHGQPQMKVFDFGPFHVDMMMGAETAEAEEFVMSGRTTKLDDLIDTAFKYLGVRYRSGHSDPHGFDCSGFTSYVFRQHDIHLTHSSRAQYNEGEHIHDIAQLKKGDLVFFGGSSRSVTSIGHVGIVTEVNPDNRTFKFIHASTSKGIRVDDSADAYYTRRYVGACRVLQ